MAFRSVRLHQRGLYAHPGQVEAVGDGITGVAMILSSKPDMALIDIGLPRLDGYQVAG